MTLLTPHRVPAIDADQTADVQSALDGLTEQADSAQLLVGGTILDLPQPVREAVADLLQRFATGQSVVIGSAGTLLTTSQAADILGISRTYVIRLIDAGKLPVQYRGTHRRITLADAVLYMESSANDRADKLDAIAALSKRTGQYDGDDF